MQIELVGLAMKSQVDAFLMSISGRRQGFVLRVSWAFAFALPPLTLIVRAAQLSSAVRPAGVRTSLTDRLPPLRSLTMRVLVRRLEPSSKVLEKARSLTLRALPETTLTCRPCLRIACCFFCRTRTLSTGEWCFRGCEAAGDEAATEATSSAARTAVAKTLVRPFIRFLSDSISGAEKRTVPRRLSPTLVLPLRKRQGPQSFARPRREPDHPLRRP